jgi:hypothetical protein
MSKKKKRRKVIIHNTIQMNIICNPIGKKGAF